MKLCLVGGFLGSGKTTAIVTAAKILARQEVPLAVITNDQGSQLVDTVFMNSLNIPGHEVKNGCLCCNYHQFYSAIVDLKDSIQPDIIFAEAVGSCADLVATIVRPLNRFDPNIDVSLSVFADGPFLLSSMEGRSSFVSDNIQYVYKKQLEEAGVIIINKSDLLTDDQMHMIESILGSDYPGKLLLFQDSRDETSVKNWLHLTKKERSGKSVKVLKIDYEKYGSGEAALAWLDGCIKIHSKERAIEKAHQFMKEMFDEIVFRQLPIGHLKFFLQAENWIDKISYTSSDGLKQKSLSKDIMADRAMITVNARVETSPEQLKKIFWEAMKKVEEPNSAIAVLDLDSFQPGYPKPTYRLTE